MDNKDLTLRIVAGADLCSGGKRLLDIGCGDGSLATLVKDKYDEVYGVDFSESAVSLAKKKGVIVSNIDLNHDALPYENNFFDTVACLDVLEHVIDPLRLLKESFRVLKPEGTIILSTPNLQYIYNIIALVFKGRSPKTSADTQGYDGGHLHYFTFKDIESLFGEAGFNDIERFDLFDWVDLSLAGKIKNIVKSIFGRNLKRDIFSSLVIVRAKKNGRA